MINSFLLKQRLSLILELDFSYTEKCSNLSVRRFLCKIVSGSTAEAYKRRSGGGNQGTCTPPDNQKEKNKCTIDKRKKEKKSAQK